MRTINGTIDLRKYFLCNFELPTSSGNRICGGIIYLVDADIPGSHPLIFCGLTYNCRYESISSQSSQYVEYDPEQRMFHPVRFEHAGLTWSVEYIDNILTADNLDSAIEEVERRLKEVLATW